MPAAANYTLEFVAHGNEVSDLAFDLSQMSAGDCIDRLAGLIAVVGEREQVAHGIQAEPQIAGPPDEGKPLQMCRVVAAVIGIGALWGREQPGFLIEADRFDLGCGRLCRFAYFHRLTL